MRRLLSLLHPAAAAGASAGLLAALPGSSWAWPRLSALHALRFVVAGWLVGVALSPLFALLVARRRPAGPGNHLPLRRRWRSVALGMATYLPPAIWLAALANGGTRKDVLPRMALDARPSIILITIDALRADYLGAYGSRAGLTPSLDAFAAQAARYNSAYAPSPWTLTSFAAIFSSLPPSECGLKLPTPRMHEWYLYSAQLPESVDLFQEPLRQSGYATAAELTNCFLTPERGWNRGFDDFRNEDGPALGAILTRASTVTQHSREWLSLARGRPFFLWVHYLDPHVPYNAPDTPRELRARFPADWLTRREYYYDRIRSADQQTRERYAAFCRAMYAQEVRYTDHWVGELLDAIRGAGLWDSSLIVITADHGEELFEHGGFEHGHSMHEEVLRVPLLVKWPAGAGADRSISQTVSLVDLGPTFLEAAGVKMPDWIRAASLPRRQAPKGDDIYAEGVLHGPEQTALITSRYKVILRDGIRPGERFLECYDRVSDREERTPLPDGQAQSVRHYLLARTERAKVAARRWRPSGKQQFRGIDLSRATREKLRALGYIGE